MNFYFSLNIDKINMHTMSFVSNVLLLAVECVHVVFAISFCLCAMRFCFCWCLFCFSFIHLYFGCWSIAFAVSFERERKKTNMSRPQPNSHRSHLQHICKIVIKANFVIYMKTHKMFLSSFHLWILRSMDARANQMKFAAKNINERKEKTSNTNENKDFSPFFLPKSSFDINCSFCFEYRDFFFVSAQLHRKIIRKW